MLADPAAERVALASVFQYGHDAWVDIADFAPPESFTVDTHRTICRCLAYFYRDGDGDGGKPDTNTIISATQTLGFGPIFQQPIERAVLKSVMETPVHLANARKMAAKVCKLHVARQLEQKVEEGKANLQNMTGDESIDEILGVVEGPIFEFSANLSSLGQDAPHRIGAGVKDYFKHLAENPVEQVGLPTGFSRFDGAIGGGIRRKSLCVIAARSGHGKTVLGDNVALFMGGRNIKTLVLDTEMGEEDHRHRMGACLAGVPIGEIENG